MQKKNSKIGLPSNILCLRINRQIGYILYVKLKH